MANNLERLQTLALMAMKLESVAAELVARTQAIRSEIEELLDNPREVQAPKPEEFVVPKVEDFK